MGLQVLSFSDSKKRGDLGVIAENAFLFLHLHRDLNYKRWLIGVGAERACRAS